MPAFGDQLGEDDVGDVLAYVRSLQADAAVAWNAANPAECRADPRPVASLLALATPSPGATPTTDATPTPPPLPASPIPPDPATGQPADEATVAAVTTTVRHLAACTNARDVLRRLAFYTDANLRPTFARTPPGFAERAALPAQPALPQDWVAIVAIEDVRLHPDGRVTARVVASTPGTHSHGPAPAAPSTAPRASTDMINTFTFAKIGDRWLVDTVTV